LKTFAFAFASIQFNFLQIQSVPDSYTLHFNGKPKQPKMNSHQQSSAAMSLLLCSFVMALLCLMSSHTALAQFEGAADGQPAMMEDYLLQ
jgi:hypothetical protein